MPGAQILGPLIIAASVATVRCPLARERDLRHDALDGAVAIVHGDGAAAFGALLRRFQLPQALACVTVVDHGGPLGG